MIKLEKMLGSDKMVCFVVESEDYETFLRYCRDNGFHWEKKEIDSESDAGACSRIMRVSADKTVKYTNGWSSMITTRNIIRYCFRDVMATMESEGIEKDLLPALPEQYNADYAVSAETIDAELLKQSGYCIAHVPDIAMKNRTRSAWLLNPYCRTATDAAGEDDVSMEFGVYCKMLYDNK